MSLEKKILVLGSRATITNLPVQEVRMLAQGSLPDYGYDPGDFIELLAGNVTVEEGRSEQFLTWLSSFLTTAGLTPQIRTLAYGRERKIFQIFKQLRFLDGSSGHGWFMVHQILPPGGRHVEAEEFDLAQYPREHLCGNAGIIVIDDGGAPPAIACQMKELNPEAWVVAMGISAARWEEWAGEFGESFVLFCRRSDLDTSRMEMDAAILWESVCAMILRALKSPEVGLWDANQARFRCHVIVQMYPGGILYAGPCGIYFRHREGRGSRPDRGSNRRTGSVPCYDTLAPAMLVVDCLRLGEVPAQRNFFYDYSKRVLRHWVQIFVHGYYFTDGLEFPNLDFVSTYPNGAPASFLDRGDDVYFFDLPQPGPDFDRTLELVSSQEWSMERKAALRSFLRPTRGIEERTLGLGQACALRPEYFRVILSVLHRLKEEVNRRGGFDDLRLFRMGAFVTVDPAEIEPVISLQGVMESYVTKEFVKRPLCIGVFGPPGSGKSFAVEEVSRIVARRFTVNPFELFQFNLTQFSGPEEINSAIDLVRASVAKGKIPIAFWDEFDCRYNGDEFGYLRYFLPSMQDGVTYVHGTPRYIGRSIFVFAGGVKESWNDMLGLLARQDKSAWNTVKALKIPDFMSRLRVVMDIEGIEIPDRLLSDSASPEELDELHRILIKRAFVIAHQMNTHWKKAARKTSGLLLRLLLARYKFGARSLEAVIETSQAEDRIVYGLPELIPPSAARIHAEWRVDLERRVDKVRKELGLRGVW
ncbi:MAG: ATPase [Deltaproteobacteria bacterium]